MTAAIAHRGDPVLFRENTLPSLLSAVASGADMVEIDLRLTVDGEVVVCHDRTLERMWGCGDAVDQLTLTQVRRIATNGYSIPTFREVLDAVPGELMVDLSDSRVVPRTVLEVEEAGATGRCLFVTEDIDALFELRDLSAKSRLGVTWNSAVPPGDDVLDGLRAECLNPCWFFLSRRLVTSTHERGMSVSAWTVDRPADMRLLLGLRIDYVVTNDVRTFVKTRMGA